MFELILELFFVAPGGGEKQLMITIHLLLIDWYLFSVVVYLIPKKTKDKAQTNNDTTLTFVIDWL